MFDPKNKVTIPALSVPSPDNVSSPVPIDNMRWRTASCQCAWQGRPTALIQMVANDAKTKREQITAVLDRGPGLEREVT